MKKKFLSTYLLLALLLGIASSSVRVSPVFADKYTPDIVGWGMNGHLQTSVPAGLSDVTAFSAGGYHSLALKSDGTVIAWGCGGGFDFGQCTVPADLTGVTAISAGYYHNLALKSDGTVVAWGENDSGQSTVPAGLSDVIAISAGGYHSLALKGDGTIVAWGSLGQADVPTGLSGVTAISSGGSHNLVLKNDGTVVAWGCSTGYDFYQCNVPAGLTGVTAISAGWYHSLALKNDGTVIDWGGWGRNITPPPGLNNVIAIAAGGGHALALKNDGTVVAWGDNSFQQAIVPAGLSDATAISAGFIHSLAFGLMNHEPVAQNQSVTTNQDTEVDITLAATDVDNDSLTYSIVAGPSHGTLSGAAPLVTYTPVANYVGRDSFTYNANDGELASNVAKVSIAVFSGNAAPPQVVVPESGPALDVNVVTVNDGPGGQTDPHLSGDWVTYTDNSVNGVRFQNLDLGFGSDRLIPHPDGNYDSLSDINGNTIVFVRMMTGSTPIYMSQINIFGDPDPAVEISPVVGALRHRSAIGGDTIVYQDRSFDPSPYSLPEIAISSVQDPTAPTHRLTNDDKIDQFSAVSPDGNAVAWVKCESASVCDVWRAERTGGVWGAPEPVSVSEDTDSLPDTNGPVTVFGSTTPDGDAKIHWSVKDSSGAYTEYMLAFPGNQRNPNIAGDFITFESSPAIGQQYDIWLYDLVTNRLYQLTNTPISESWTDVTISDTAPGGIILVRVAWAQPKQVYPYDLDVYAMSFVLDITAPLITSTVSGIQGQNDWYTSDVSLTWSVSDDESEINSTNGCDPITVTSDQAATQYICSATSNGGTASQTVSIARDTTKPATVVTGVQEGATYSLGSVPQAGCATTDDLSGVASEATMALTGGDAQGVGAITATCSGALDAAGNAANPAVVHFTIVNPLPDTYSFTGFFQPVDNPGEGPSYIFNSVKAGSAIPVKFSLGGDHGLSIFAPGFPTSKPASCTTATLTEPIEETVTAGSSSLSYDAASDTYTYIWKTYKKWAGTCRMLNVTLDDGTKHTAYFNFK